MVHCGEDCELGTGGKSLLLFTKHILVVLQQSLYRNPLLLDIAELSLDVHGTHDGGSKHDSKVERRHLGLC